jgi:hypothetical protein
MSDDYMYFACIKFILLAKQGCAFHECSPMLWDISGVPSWEKVMMGMMKMYMKEVLQKHPVIKHLKFGSIIKFQKHK